MSAVPSEVAAAAHDVLDDVVAWKVRDPHMSEAECHRMRAVAAAAVVGEG
jgi:hypothetical protein